MSNIEAYIPFEGEENYVSPSKIGKKALSLIMEYDKASKL